MAEKKCKWCNGTGNHYSVYIKQYVVCDACKGEREGQRVDRFGAGLDTEQNPVEAA